MRRSPRQTGTPPVRVDVDVNVDMDVDVAGLACWLWLAIFGVAKRFENY